MPHLLLKRTFKQKDRSNEKSLSFHGAAATPALMTLVNEAVAMNVKYAGHSKLLTFAMPREGHYYASMNHDFAKKHEEDAICILLDVLEENGWYLNSQYDYVTTIRYE